MEDNKDIIVLIEQKRMELLSLVKERKYFDEAIVKKSQELDNLLNQLSYSQKKTCAK